MESLHKIVDNRGNVLERNVELNYAVEKVRELYLEHGIVKKMTGIAIVCTHAVKVLTLHELEYVINRQERFFFDREFDRNQQAFVVSNAEYEDINQNVTKFYIMNM